MATDHQAFASTVITSTTCLWIQQGKVVTCPRSPRWSNWELWFQAICSTTEPSSSRCQLPMMRTWLRLCIKTKGALKDKCIRRQKKHSFSKNRFEIFCCVHNNFLPHLGRLALVLSSLTRVSPCHGSSGSPKDTPTPPSSGGRFVPPSL